MDTCNYIERSIKFAERNSSVFSDNTKAEIHKRSNGIPRRINRICLRTLFERAANKCTIIDHADLIFDDVQQNLLCCQTSDGNLSWPGLCIGSSDPLIYLA